MCIYYYTVDIRGGSFHLIANLFKRVAAFSCKHVHIFDVTNCNSRVLAGTYLWISKYCVFQLTRYLPKAYTGRYFLQKGWKFITRSTLGCLHECLDSNQRCLGLWDGNLSRDLQSQAGYMWMYLESTKLNTRASLRYHRIVRGGGLGLQLISRIMRFPTSDSHPLDHVTNNDTML